MNDVLVVGAGPAGAVAAAVLARAGARVSLVDRALFPREKLCGDTVNPGAIADLKRLGLAAALDRHSRPIDGVLVTGEGGVSIAGKYPDGLAGRSIVRRDLDWLLLQDALKAGARFEPGVTVRRALLAGTDKRPRVTGVATDRGERLAHVVIAADGRRSAVTASLSMARRSGAPARWAIGGYFSGACATSTFVEMHVRRGWYVGIVAVPQDLVRVCMVTSPERIAAGSFQEPAKLLQEVLAADAHLGGRFADARLTAPPVVLGPLAVGEVARTMDGLLLAGDAAGFIDPMTGDGLRFAIRGGELAALAALDALACGWAGVHQKLARTRQRNFGAKWRFDRMLRAVVSSPQGVAIAATCAKVAPAVVRSLAARAGDCRLAGARRYAADEGV